VEFLDSFGLGVLLGALRRARTHDGDLVLACSRQRLLHLLEVTRLRDILTVVEHAEQVLAPGSN
jgi:anti-sigma B factor antagonist